MSTDWNPLDHPVCLEEPERRASSSWAEHVPFGMWLVSVLRPKVVVELGTFRGTSYCGFCQAIQKLGLPTRAFAVDDWTGDPHHGVMDRDVLEELKAYHDGRYGAFSTLLPMKFDRAAELFRDGQIDLLHIDGYHTYDAARHDFETWRPKLSSRGVVLMHDIAERTRDFGVWKLWGELAERYPTFAFEHEHGLGVLAAGSDVPAELQGLFDADDATAGRIHALFETLGRKVRLLVELDAERTRSLDTLEAIQGANDSLLRAAGRQDVLKAERVDFEAAIAELPAHERERRRLERESRVLRSTVARLCTELEQRDRQSSEFQSSLSWRLVHRLAGVGEAVAPVGSTRRKLLRALDGKALGY